MISIKIIHFLNYVLVPEVALRLIMIDYNVLFPVALKLMSESSSYGLKFYPDNE